MQMKLVTSVVWNVTEFIRNSYSPCLVKKGENVVYAIASGGYDVIFYVNSYKIVTCNY